MRPLADTVDIIVPVYRGLGDTQRCIRSVQASRCRTPWRLVVVNDASPDPELTAWLRTLPAHDPRVLLLENDENLGFVGTVNRGMGASATHDALLLNSDTEVVNDWLDRLRGAAYSAEKVASVTPFSNNATICSYPRFCQGNTLPAGWDTAQLDAVFAKVNAGQVIDIPTGVGFCMYLRRDALQALGVFDVKTFGKGYGEENDFSRRAVKAGWRNLHALDTFVLHTGGVSFGDSKSAREVEAGIRLRRLHPEYDTVVHDFVNSDPAWPARVAADLARVQASDRRRVLAVVHNRAGGTLRHVRELADGLARQAIFFVLSPQPANRVRLELLDEDAQVQLDFALPDQWQSLLAVLRAVGVAHVHFHHLLGHREEIRTIASALGVRWDFTAHDYFVMCRNVCLIDSEERFCGEQGGGECQKCAVPPSALGQQGAPRDWRAANGPVVSGSRHVLVPSRDTGRRFARMWPAADVRFAPHGDLAPGAPVPAPQPRKLGPDATLKVAVVGALSRFKGGDLLEDVARLAARGAHPIEFHLIGYAYRNLRTAGTALTVHGPYDEDDLPRLLSELAPDLVWFPVLVPETYSYTLSAALAAGLPIAASNLGAFPERLSGRPWTWLLPWDAPAPRWLEVLLAMRSDHFVSGRSPPPYIDAAPATDANGLAGWSYARDYLTDIPRPSRSAPGADLPPLSAHRPVREVVAGRRSVKLVALRTLVRLRSAPPLRGLARAIPLAWQTRLKTWLVR